MMLKLLQGYTYMGSGFLIDDNVLLTAGHCLYNTKSYGSWGDHIYLLDFCDS
ncbi:MAG: trypsin-like serine protease [Angelakisella sp.]|nr:trypsin-like serine protease [Angelakisella sp.]